MTDFGVTDSGFVLKRLTDIKDEIRASMRATFGPGINVREDELLGQLIGIFAEREALIWEGMQEVYDSSYPDSASDVSLDHVVAITGIKRLEATKGTVVATAYGTEGTEIPTGSVVSVDGNPDARFKTLTSFIIGPGVDEVQLVQFSAVPDAGNWTLIFDGEETGTLAFNDNAAAVQTALNSLASLSGVTVSGDYTSGFTVTFSGADGQQDQSMLRAGTNTLTNTGTQVNLAFSEDTVGVLPNVEINLEAEDSGQIPAYAGTLTVIETPVSGWDSVTNAADADMGTEAETDAEMRLRRAETLATAGAGTLESIKSRILEIDEVDDARVFENDTDTTDILGRPPHSVHAVVVGGDDGEIAQAIWDVKAAGIQTFGSVSVDVTDTQGFAHAISFDRPTEIDIWVIVNITVNDDFPSGGDESIKELIVDYAADNLGIADDVLDHKVAAAISDGIVGVETLEVLIGTSNPPTLPDNIAIGEVEIASFDTSRITVNVS